MNAVVAERGQVTIPKRFRDRLGIGPSTVVDFEEDGGRLILTKVVGEDSVSKVTEGASGAASYLMTSSGSFGVTHDNRHRISRDSP